jgi:acyl-CoA thioesterase
MDLSTVGDARRVAEGSYQANVPDGWQQGRGAFGGLTLSMLVRSMEQDVAALAEPAPPLRTLSGELLAPVLPGAVALRVEVLRRGSGLLALDARLVQDGEVRAHAVGLFGRARREPATWCELERPTAPPWRDAPTIDLSVGGPTFARFFEYRVVAHPPFAGEGTARTLAWVRAREASRRDAAYVAAMADAVWPAAFGRLDGPHPMGTISYTLDVLGTLDGLDRDAPLLHRAWAPAARDGYHVEHRELWGEDGRLVALNRQTFAFL